MQEKHYTTQEHMLCQLITSTLSTTECIYFSQVYRILLVKWDLLIAGQYFN